MSTRTGRASIGEAALMQLLDPDFRRWLDAWDDVTDEDGDIVLLSFVDTEDVNALHTASRPHRHSVVMSTYHDGSICMWVLGPPDTGTRPEKSPRAHAIDMREVATVGDLVDKFLSLPEGTLVELNFAADRRTAILAPAA